MVGLFFALKLLHKFIYIYIYRIAHRATILNVWRTVNDNRATLKLSFSCMVMMTTMIVMTLTSDQFPFSNTSVIFKCHARHRRSRALPSETTWRENCESYGPRWLLHEGQKSLCSSHHPTLSKFKYIHGFLVLGVTVRYCATAPRT